MKLFVWENCFCSHTPGLGVVIVENIEEAKEVLRKKMTTEGYTWLGHEDIDKTPKIFNLTKPRAFFVYGGD